MADVSNAVPLQLSQDLNKAVSAIQATKAAIPAELTWLQKHERLIIVILVLLFAGFIGNKLINREAAVDKQKATLAEQQLAAQKSKDDALAAQIQVSTTQYQQLVVQLSQQNAQLASDANQRNAALIKQQALDQTLSNPQLAARIQQIAPKLANTVTPNANGVEVTPQGAREAVSELENIPVLEKDLQDSQQINANQQQELDKSNQLVGQLNLDITGLNTQIKDADLTCKAQLTAANAEARKGKLRWFKWGFVAGFVSGVFVTHGA